MTPPVSPAWLWCGRLYADPPCPSSHPHDQLESFIDQGGLIAALVVIPVYAMRESPRLSSRVGMRKRGLPSTRAVGVRHQQHRGRARPQWRSHEVSTFDEQNRAVSVSAIITPALRPDRNVRHCSNCVGGLLVGAGGGVAGWRLVVEGGVGSVVVVLILPICDDDAGVRQGPEDVDVGIRRGPGC